MRPQLRIPLLAAALLAVLAPTPALAYVGPGAGITLVGAVLGLAVALASSVGILVLWPLRQWRKRHAKASADGAESGEARLAGTSAE